VRLQAAEERIASKHIVDYRNRAGAGVLFPDRRAGHSWRTPTLSGPDRVSGYQRRPQPLRNA
jgi:hypothetical protein